VAFWNLQAVSASEPKVADARGGAGASQLHEALENIDGAPNNAAPAATIQPNSIKFAKAREAAGKPSGLGACSSSTLGGDFSGNQFYA
jgi:hypothetical protein